MAFPLLKMEVVHNGIFIKCPFCVMTWQNLTLQYDLVLEQELIKFPADHPWPDACLFEGSLLEQG